MVNQRDGLNRTFAALSDPTRRALLRRLAAGALHVTELARPFSMSLPAISKHVSVLEKAGLLERERKGRNHLLRLRANPLREAEAWLEAYRGFWENSLAALAAHLERDSPDPVNANPSPSSKHSDP